MGLQYMYTPNTPRRGLGGYLGHQTGSLVAEDSVEVHGVLRDTRTYSSWLDIQDELGGYRSPAGSVRVGGISPLLFGQHLVA